MAIDYDTASGMDEIIGVRGAFRIPIGTVALSPVVSAGWEHSQYRRPYYEPEKVALNGLDARAGLDLVLPTLSNSWLAVGLAGGWSTVQAGPIACLSFKVGTSFRHGDPPPAD